MIQSKLFSFSIACGIALTAIGQPTETRKLTVFSSLEVNGNVIVFLVKAQEPAAELYLTHVGPNEVELLVTDKKLQIKCPASFNKEKKVQIKLFYTGLDDISISNSANLSADGAIKTDSLRLSLKTGSEAYLDLEVDKLQANVSERSVLSVKGNSRFQQIHVSLGATFSGFDLLGDKAQVKCTSGGKAKLTISSDLNCSASGNGYITYKGNPPKVEKTETTGGKVIPYKD